MITADCHMHTNFSSDSDALMEDMILASIQKEMDTICFTEHMDFDFPENEEGLTFQVDMEAYQNKVYELKEKYKNNIKILFGIELGIMPHLTQRLKDFQQNYSFDFVIGSTHLIDGMDPYNPEYFGKYTEETEGFQRAFEMNLENLLAYDKMNTVGHLDYVVRYARNKDTNYHPQDYKDILDTFLKTCIQKGVGLEVNSAGIKYGLMYPNPHIDILKRYKQLGGEIITIGSDAHLPMHIAYAFDQLEDYLTEAGFSHYAVFQNGNPQFRRI